MVKPLETAPAGAPRVPYPLEPTNLAGAYTTPAPPVDLDPGRAGRAQLARAGLLWRRPNADAPAALQRVWAAAFARPWPAADRIVPHQVPTPGFHPSRRRATPDDSEVTDANWAGAVITGRWTTAIGSWVVPTVSRPHEPQGTVEDGWDSSSWVGLDGADGSSDVLQAGVRQRVDADGHTSYSTWYEWFAPHVKGSPEYVDPITIDNLDVQPGDTIWASIQYSGTLPPPAQARSIAGYQTAFNEQLHVVYLDADGHVHELFFDGSWHHNDLFTQASGRPVPATPGSALVGYATEFNEQQHIGYLDGEGHVHELFFDGSWHHNDLFAQASGTPIPAAPGTPLTGYVTGFNEQQHLNYLDAKGQVQELFFDGSWHHNNLSAQASGSPVGAGRGSQLDAYSTEFNQQQHINYVDSLGHVHELFFDGSWHNNDLFAEADGEPVLAAAGTALDGYATTFSGDNQQHVNYLDAVGHVHELVFTDHWIHNDLTEQAQAQPAVLGSPLDGYQSAWNDQQHVNYLDTAGNVRELIFDNGVGAWVGNDLDDSATGAVLAGASSPLSGWVSTFNRQQHVNYLDSLGRVHELFWDDGNGVWVHNDLSAMATITGLIFIGNDRTREHFSITLTAPPAASFDGNVAEWIMEAPGGGIPNVVLPRFTDVTFTAAVCCGPNGAVGDPSHADTFDVSGFGATLTSTATGVDTVTISYTGQ